MEISFAATNPCHVWDMARALHGRGELGCYYSGYPAWRLRGADGTPIRSFPLRTLAVYGARRLLPESLRPKDRYLFRWQDWAFDQKVANQLAPCDFLHGLPGQCLETFRRCRTLGISTVLSHATGPVANLESRVAPEYKRVGLEFSRETQYDDAYYRREEEEYALADYHWAASEIVAERLAGVGIAHDRIWVVPYGVDKTVFSPQPARKEDGTFRLLFAGQLSLRKGIRFLLGALEKVGDRQIELHFYGDRMAEVDSDLQRYTGESSLHFHGSVSQPELAEAFSKADLLVLPSLEEGYGLVVTQALACGLPCLVSDEVGAKDAVKEGLNGSIVPVGDTDAWATAIEKARHQKWDAAAIQASAPSWETAAQILIEKSESCLV